MNEPEEKPAAASFDQWCVLELMGKVRLGGRVMEAKLFGVDMIRIDIPNREGRFILTRYFHPNSLYGVTPVSREGAIAVAIYNDQPPVHQWEMRQLVAPAPGAVDADEGGFGAEADLDDEDDFGG